MKLIDNHTYRFKIKKFQFGDLSKEDITDLFHDGRIASYFLEKQLTHWFSNLVYVSGNKDHDHIDPNTGNKYDAKCFTFNGCSFMPSNQIGAGRCFQLNRAMDKAKQLRYIITDITEFPFISVKSKCGLSLAEEYPDFKISYYSRKKFFG